MRAAVITLLTLIAVTLPVPGAAAADNGNLMRQRALFRELMNKASSGTLERSSPRLGALRGYPLYAYVIAAHLRYRLQTDPGIALDKRIAAFIAGHPDLPPARRLRDPWLESLGARGRWQQVLAHTPPEADTADRCRAVHARIELGQSPRDAALALWRVGRSQPKTCNPVLAWLDKQGLLTRQQILYRAKLSYLSGHYGMVRYLAGKLPRALAAKTEQWLAVAHNPELLAQVRGLPDDILVHAFKRFALQDWGAAAELYPKLVKRFDPGGRARYEMKRYIALLFAQDQKPQALIWFARLDASRMDAHARAWRARAAIWQQRWPLVIDAIRAMPPEQAREEEWRYWLGRALLATGQTKKAGRILGELAGHRSYHGYLAADLLGLDYSFDPRPLPPHPKARARVLALPALARARELKALGRDWLFRLEWNEVIDDLNKIELREAARIASRRGWHSRAIITLAKGGYWDALDIRYPTPYTTAVRRSAAGTGLSPAYVLAIIRSESLFMPAVVSPAGAVGLMQLMPATADMVARRNDLAPPSRSDLRRPAVNIRLGTNYLQRMLARFGGNLALATAAYNAGPNAVERWLPRRGTVPPAIWIANISYTQTREYVQRVLAHMTVFRHRLTGNAVPLEKRLAPVQPAYNRTTA